MLNMKVISALCVALSFAVVPAFAQKSSDVLEDYFRQYKYKSIRPPVAFDPSDSRTEKWWRPGFVFVVDSSKRARGVECESIFQAPPVKAYWLGDNKAAVKRSGSFSLLANLLQPFGNISDVNADAGFSWDKNTAIEFGDLKELQPEHAIFKGDIKSLGSGKSATTDSIRMSARCARAIRKHIRDGASVYLVISSVEAESISISVDDRSGFSAKAGFSLSKMINFKPGVEAKNQTASSVAFSLQGSPIRLAYSAVRIRKAESTGEVSAGAGQKNKLTVDVPDDIDIVGFEYE
jgi:hypothetical protein